VVLRWDEELLQAIRANPAGTGPTVTARAIGVAHTSMFDAWAAYDSRAVGWDAWFKARPYIDPLSPGPI
jgi:hypothetical protein